MSLPIPSSAQNGQPPQKNWTLFVPYLTPPVAACGAIVPIFRDLIAKTAQQKGQPIPNTTYLEGLKAGAKAMPTVGVLIGTQMILQKIFEKSIHRGDSNEVNLPSMFASSAAVGFLSSPIVAIFNAKPMGWTAWGTLRKFTVKQGFAITIQETAFVAGIAAADKASEAVKKKFEGNTILEYLTAFGAGAAGSLAGHPANTALTRWQCGMAVNSLSQLMWGAIRKARGIGCFSVLYKFGKEALNSTARSSD